MQDAPERIWFNAWDRLPRMKNDGASKEYTRTDLCITGAECQRRIDAAVLAEREAWYDATSQQFGNLMAIHTEVKAAAIRARGRNDL